MTRGNDAIPSWSGFNYQGKMMLLCVMEKIYSIIVAAKDLTKYEVELEKREDYVFIEDGKSSELYQVKATLSKSKWKEHEKALEKLIKHRDSSDNPTAPCYFVVARPMNDWGETTNPYASSVNIYKYNGNEVKVDEVKKYICTEIEKVLNHKGINFQNIEVVYGSLCIFVDDKIAQMHKQAARVRKYRIRLSEFFEIVLNSVEKIEAGKKYVLKERAYEHMINVIQKSLEDICQQNCRENYEDCERECAAKTAYKKVLGLTDLRKYCKVINPAVLNEWEDDMSYAEYFSKEKITWYILGLFFESKDSALIEDNGSFVGMRSKINPISQGVIIPTLLNLVEPFDSIENSTQNKLQILRDNADVLNELLGNSITVESNDYFNGKSISQTQITSAWEKFEKKQIGSIPCDIGFVTVRDLRKYFEDKGGNHE